MVYSRRQCNDPKISPKYAHKFFKAEAFKRFILTKKMIVTTKRADLGTINDETVYLTTCHKNLSFEHQNLDYI